MQVANLSRFVVASPPIYRISYHDNIPYVRVRVRVCTTCMCVSQICIIVCCAVPNVTGWILKVVGFTVDHMTDKFSDLTSSPVTPPRQPAVGMCVSAY